MGNKFGQPSSSNNGQSSASPSASLSSSSFTTNRLQSSKEYNLEIIFCFFKLLQHRDWTTVQNAILSNPMLAAQRDPFCCTTLHFACSLDPTLEVINTIYHAYPDAIHMADNRGRLPIHVAIVNGADCIIIQQLLSHNRESIVTGCYRGQIPLHHLLLRHTTPGNPHPDALPGSRYEYHSPFPMDVFHLLLQEDSNYATAGNHGMRSNGSSSIRHMDVHGYTPLALAWESFRSVIPWNELDLEERKAVEWYKLESILYATAVAMNQTKRKQPTQHDATETVTEAEVATHPNHSSICPPVTKLQSSLNRCPRMRILHQKSTILHTAVEIGETWCPLGLFQLLIDKYPEQVMETNEEGMLPLMIALNVVLDGRSDISCPSSTATTTTTATTTNSTTPTTSTTFLNRILLQDRIETYQPISNAFIQPLLQIYPQAAQISHITSERLPLHVALNNGRGWLEGVQDIFWAYPEAIRTQDPITGFLPFMIPLTLVQYTTTDIQQQTKSQSKTTVEDNDNDQNAFLMDTVYSLLRAEPSVLQVFT